MEENKKIENQTDTSTTTKATPPKKTTTRKTTKTTIKKSTAKKVVEDKQKTSRRRRKIDRSIEVLVMNTTNGGIFYRCPKTKNEYRLSNYGDTEYVTIDELITMRNAHRKMLTKYYLLPIEIMDDTVTLDEALIFIGLDKLYDKTVYENLINYEYELDDIIFDDDFTDRFVRFAKDFQLILIERAIALFRDNKLTDYNKIEFLNKFTGRDLLSR